MDGHWKWKIGKMPASQETEITTFVAASDEWWTPQFIIEAARVTLGRIDLDPASTFDANKRTNAVIFYTQEDNGLEKEWCLKKDIYLAGKQILWYNPVNLNIIGNRSIPWRPELVKSAIESYLSTRNTSTETGNISDTYVLTVSEKLLEQDVLHVEKLSPFILDTGAEIVLIAISEDEKKKGEIFCHQEQKKYVQNATLKSQQQQNISIEMEHAEAGLVHGAKNATERLQKDDKQKGGQIYKREQRFIQRKKDIDKVQKEEHGGDAEVGLTMQDGEAGSTILNLIGLLICGKNVRIIGTISVLIVEDMRNLSRITLFQYPIRNAQEPFRQTLYPLADFVTTQRTFDLPMNGVCQMRLTLSLDTFASSMRIKFLASYSSTVLLNPPSKRGDPTARPHLWAKKLIEEYDSGHVSRAILVVKSVLGYKWYEELYQRFWVCHLRERPAFVRPDGTMVGMAKKGVSVFYLGDVEHRIKFVYHFGSHGKIVSPLGAAGGLLFSESG